MTTAIDSASVPITTGSREAPDLGVADPLTGCLEAALDASEAADVLGLDSEPLRAARAVGRRRTGFPGNAYVLALVGGTGVGKSSLLNALAGGVVSVASVRRPTTAEPVAWIPAAERDTLRPVLDWLGVEEVRHHAMTKLGHLAILDLPDVDSLAAEHRARVEALLPLVDAVAWVTDPEKYADAVLHDDFFAAWLPRLGRQVVLVNKTDRLSPQDAVRIRHDLETDLARIVSSGDKELTVISTSASLPGGTDDLLAWLGTAVDAKEVMRRRIAASLVSAARELADGVGARSGEPVRPLVDEGSRAVAVRSATEAVLRVVDLAGLERQAVAATRAQARSRGAGPLGRLTSFIYRTSGRETAVADPRRHLLRWRDRGGIGPAVEGVRDALSASIRDSPPAMRPALASALGVSELRIGVEGAIDRAIGGIGSLEPPRSRWWTVLGLLQTLATAGIALSTAWVVIWVLARPVTGSVDLPVVGPVPSPFVSLVAFLIAGYILARLLGAHAGWVGSRWAARIRDRVSAAVEQAVRERAFRRFDALEDSRERLITAVGAIERSCGSAGTERQR